MQGLEFFWPFGLKILVLKIASKMDAIKVAESHDNLFCIDPLAFSILMTFNKWANIGVSIVNL